MIDKFYFVNDNQEFLVLIAKAFKNMINDPFIHVFTIVVLFDIFTGIVKGVFFKKEGNSTKGLLGMVKHLLVVLLITTAYPYLIVLHFSGMAQTFVCFYIAVYGISIVENLGQMGVPVPKWLRNSLEKLRNDNEEKPKEKGENDHDKN